MEVRYQVCFLNDGNTEPSVHWEERIKEKVGDIAAWIQDLLMSVHTSIGKPAAPNEKWFIRIVPTQTEKMGWCLKLSRDEKGNHLSPDMTVGYTGDLNDLAGNIIHEALHYLRWDEEMVEAKTQAILGVGDMREHNV